MWRVIYAETGGRQDIPELRQSLVGVVAARSADGPVVFHQDEIDALVDEYLCCTVDDQVFSAFAVDLDESRSIDRLTRTATAWGSLRSVRSMCSKPLLVSIASPLMYFAGDPYTHARKG